MGGVERKYVLLEGGYTKVDKGDGNDVCATFTHSRPNGRALKKLSNYQIQMVSSSTPGKQCYSPLIGTVPHRQGQGQGQCQWKYVYYIF